MECHRVFRMFRWVIPFLSTAWPRFALILYPSTHFMRHYFMHFDFSICVWCFCGRAHPLTGPHFHCPHWRWCLLLFTPFHVMSYRLDYWPQNIFDSASSQLKNKTSRRCSPVQIYVFAYISFIHVYFIIKHAKV